MNECSFIVAGPVKAASSAVGRGDRPLARPTVLPDLFDRFAK
jgi:hypothetical protein